MPENNNYDYTMSEQVFIDVWQHFGSPSEIHGSRECYKFLTELMQVTNGLVIVDRFSGANYDHIHRIDLKGDYIYIYWKCFEQNTLDVELMYEVFGNANYLYTVCKISKIKFYYSNNHLFILFLPIVMKIKEAKIALDLTRLIEGKQYIINDNHEKFENKIAFIKDGKKHICTLTNFPFYSFLIQPKENNRSAGFSSKLLMHETISIVIDRLKKVENILNSVSKHDYDEIQSAGNRIRIVLESLIKYYCLYCGYSLPNIKSYSDNMLGQLKNHLRKNNDDILDLFSQDVINTANDFSHDNGGVYIKLEAMMLLKQTADIVKEISKRLKER